MTFQINDIVVHKETGKYYKVTGKHYHYLICRSVNKQNVERLIKRHMLDLVPNQILSSSQLAGHFLLIEKNELSRHEAHSIIETIYDNLAKECMLCDE